MEAREARGKHGDGSFASPGGSKRTVPVLPLSPGCGGVFIYAGKGIAFGL